MEDLQSVGLAEDHSESGGKNVSKMTKINSIAQLHQWKCRNGLAYIRRLLIF